MELALCTDARNGTVFPNILQRQPTELRDVDGTPAHLNLRQISIPESSGLLSMVDANHK
jgi:hypothetical protein